MYKNLNAESLGISARQNELIELVLTYKFRGLDLDIEPLMKQVELRGREHSLRYLASAQVKIGGFELPVCWEEDDATYREDLQRLSLVAEVAGSLGATGCTTMVMPYSDGRPYHESFEFHRARLTEIAELLQGHGIRLGLGFRAPAHARDGHSSPFITTPDALLTLIKTIVAPNVGICLDLWHWHVAGGTLEQLKDVRPDRIVTVRLADVPADVALADITEQQRLLPASTGIVPAAAALRLLAERGYKGPVAAYCHPAQFAGITRSQVVEQASRALTKLLEGAADDTGSAAQEAATVSKTPAAR